MANAKLRRKARGELHELQTHELGLVSGGIGGGPGTGGGYFDVNGGDYFRNHRVGRRAALSNARNIWQLLCQ